MISRKKIVYIARNTHSGLVKVGISIDPLLRAYQLSLQTGAVVKMCWTQRVKGPAEYYERHLLACFATNQVSGDWFRLDPDSAVLQAKRLVKKLGASPIPKNRLEWPRLPWKHKRKLKGEQLTA